MMTFVCFADPQWHETEPPNDLDTLQDFLRNNRGINDGADLPEEYMGHLYDSIVGNEIKMKVLIFKQHSYLLLFHVSQHHPGNFPAGQPVVVCSFGKESLKRDQGCLQPAHDTLLPTDTEQGKLATAALAPP